MKLIKISPKHQITIPKHFRHLCETSWLSVTSDCQVIILRPVQIKEGKTEEEILNESFGG